MKTMSRLLLALVAFGLTAPASAQTADEVIEKCMAALGGRAALAKITSRTMIGTITVATPQGELSGPVEIYAQSPNKSRTLIKLDLAAFGAGEMTVDQRFDGNAGYIIDTLQGNRDITGGQLENMRNGAFPTVLLHYKERGITAELAAREKVSGRDAYVLVFTARSGSPTRQYIDAETYLPMKTVVKVEVPQLGEVEQTSELSDYRDVDGVKVPFAVRAVSSVQSSTIAITRVEHNAPIDPALFSKP